MKYADLPLASRAQKSMNTEVIKFHGKIKRESEKAICFCVFPTEDFNDNTGAKDHWFPFSQVKSIHKTFSVANETLDSIVVTAWIAKQKNLIGE